MNFLIFSKFVLFLSVFFFSKVVCCWGERGHSIITRVASEILKIYSQPNTSLGEVFHKKQLLLSHLSNVPDNVWKSSLVSAEIRAINAPNHWIDLEYLCVNPFITCIPSDIDKAKQIAQQHGKDLIKDVGTLIWRIDDLAKYLQKAFLSIESSSSLFSPYNFFITKLIKSSYKHDKALLRQILIYAGVLSHFVGDASNPLHLTIDYDGVLRGQKGIHRYFEEEIVDIYGFELETLVLNYALSYRPFNNLVIEQLNKHNFKKDFMNISIALVVNNYKQLEELFSIDKTYAIINSVSQDVVRKNVHEVYKFFEPILIKQLALGADTLAHLWLMSWSMANNPLLNKNELVFEYPVVPEFIYPKYLESYQE